MTALGVGPGDRVAVALPNCPQHVAAVTAILRLGAAVVEHNPLYTAAELELQFSDHQARVAIVFDRVADTFTSLRGRTPLETVIAVNMLDAMPLHLRAALALPLPPLRRQRAELTAATPAPGTIDIEDITVVGRPRADGSEDVVACVTLVDGSALDPEGLKTFARQRLTRYKVPRDFYHFERLERDQTGKIRRREVRGTLLSLLTQP